MISDIRGTARGQIPARLLDLSVGGALLHLSMPLEVGAIHDFALQIDGQTVWVQGEVKRSSRPRPAPATSSASSSSASTRGDQRRLQSYLNRSRRA